MRSINALVGALAALAIGTAIHPPSRAAQAAEPQSQAVDLTKWTPPDLATVKDDDLGKLIKYGYALTTETYKHLGPEVADPAKRYSGNNLACQSCHLNAGTQPYAMPWTGVHAVFPMYRAREDGISTIEERVNGCMQRSMNGKALPLDSTEMKAFVAYMKWLSTGIPVGAKIEGAGTKAIKEPGRAANPDRGRQVYAEVCAACHQPDGQGVRKGQIGDAGGYQFPPLWGPDSYNDGAGMYRGLTAAAFVHNNMPLGTTHEAPVLSDEDAYDVIAFVNSQPRPHKEGVEKDFPNRLRKPVDMPFPPFADGFSAEQHKYGPYDPIRAKLKELRQATQ
ncbi:c-type cytochrome [Azospirillum brasilense]|uniref:Cystathionine gamma-synthase n=1 Tax=Azospirillum brasilense TaxID=192 RepID=A0A6L3B192_AZOBR|nr:c-type cytochrome [Azospirillum brasilense]KAA0686084.1 cystathionine gamma-synthase [Azospirillum brasilense]